MQRRWYWIILLRLEKIVELLRGQRFDKPICKYLRSLFIWLCGVFLFVYIRNSHRTLFRFVRVDVGVLSLWLGFINFFCNVYLTSVNLGARKGEIWGWRRPRRWREDAARAERKRERTKESDGKSRRNVRNQIVSHTARKSIGRGVGVRNGKREYDRPNEGSSSKKVLQGQKSTGREICQELNF